MAIHPGVIDNLPRARFARMERFVELVVAGGLVLVAGLWLWVLSPAGSPAWVASIVLAVAGTGVVLSGIWGELDQ